MHVETLSNHAVTGILDILWSDGKQQQFTHAFLRGHCQCADCKALHRQGEGREALSAQCRITDMCQVGVYGVQIIFSDGHDRGIYPWSYLRELHQMF